MWFKDFAHQVLILSTGESLPLSKKMLELDIVPHILSEKFCGLHICWDLPIYLVETISNYHKGAECLDCLKKLFWLPRFFAVQAFLNGILPWKIMFSIFKGKYEHSKIAQFGWSCSEALSEIDIYDQLVW